jgi:hypothetical protein
MVESTARTYATQAVMFDNMGHNMMVEPAWESVAERIAAWLEA